MARGSITPRPTNDGKMRYRIKWETTGPDGKRVHHSATRRTKDEADRFLAKKLGEVNEGTFVAPSKETVESYLARWLQAASVRLSGGTVYQYEAEIRKRLLPHIGKVPLAKLDEARIQGTYAKLLAAGYAPSTVDKTHRMLHTAMKQAVAWRLLQRNPVDGVTSPRIVAAAPVAWSADECAIFLDLTADDSLAPLWRLGLDSGMRLGEILALSWRDLDVERRVVRVQRSLTRDQAGSWKIGEHAKTSSSRRAIALGDSTATALRGLRAPQAERRLACGGAWVDLNLIFDGGNGKWITPTSVRRQFDAACERVRRAGHELPEITPHGMRHTMATLLLVAGVHPKVVQERLGHKTVQITLDRYSHVAAGMQEEAADVLERLLGGRSRPRRGQESG